MEGSFIYIQGGSNMTGTDYMYFTQKLVPVIFETPCIMWFSVLFYVSAFVGWQLKYLFWSSGSSTDTTYRQNCTRFSFT